MELGISEEELKGTGDTPATPTVGTKEINYLIALVVKARELLLLCAPQFAAGSEGARVLAAVRDSLPSLRTISAAANPTKEAANGESD